MKSPDSLNSYFSDIDTQYAIVYCYPKDDTPGCTKEAQEFSMLQKEFEKHNASIFGVSPQDDECHRKFIEKYNLSIHLIADEQKNILQDLQVWQEKKNYGKTYMGVVRSTFCIDTKTQEIVKEWRNVKAEGHAKKVLDFIIAL